MALVFLIGTPEEAAAANGRPGSRLVPFLDATGSLVDGFEGVVRPHGSRAVIWHCKKAHNTPEDAASCAQGWLDGYPPAHSPGVSHTIAMFDGGLPCW
jgi:hypothetical protein